MLLNYIDKVNQMYMISNIAVKTTGTHQHKQTKLACLLVMRAYLLILFDHLSLTQSRWSDAGHQWLLAWTAAKKKTRGKGEMMEEDRPSSAQLGGSLDAKSLLSPTENCWGMTTLTQKHRVSALKRQRLAGSRRLSQVVWIFLSTLTIIYSLDSSLFVFELRYVGLIM